MTSLTESNNDFSLVPQNLQQAMELATMMAQSDMVPKNFKGKPGDVLIAVQMGLELGFSPTQAVQNIAPINGRPSLWGDGFRALILSAPDLVALEESYDEATKTAHCRIVRRRNGQDLVFTGSFSMEDAKLAGLLGKGGPWTQYPKRMQQWRALGFTGRDAYADRLRGIQLAEEVMDIPKERELNPRTAPTTKSSTLNSLMVGSGEQTAKEAGSSAKKLPRLDVDDVLLAIGEAGDLTELQRIFGESWTAAKQHQDSEAADRIKATYDTRKAELQATE